MLLVVIARQGSELDGNWLTNFNWARTDAEPFRRVAFGNILGFEAAKVTPQYVIEGIPAAAYDDVLAGIFYGWLNHNAALTFQAKHGSGSLFATTLQFDDYPNDVYTRRLLDAMISYVGSAKFRPVFGWQWPHAATVSGVESRPNSCRRSWLRLPRPRADVMPFSR